MISNDKHENDELKKRISEIIKDYDNQGIHRTGTKVDLNSAHWLEKEVKRIGLNPYLDEFTINRLDIIETSLNIDNKKIDGIPLFDCIFPDNKIIIGKLGFLKEKNTIGIARTNNDRFRHLKEYRRSNQHLGLVFITQGLTPGLSLINAENFKEPFGPPTLQISSDYWSWTKSNVGKEATLTFKTKRTPTKAFNVNVRIKGKNSNLAPLIVMTPRSGWWNCASERGGGIAILLEMMHNFYINPPYRDVIFLANSGHELGHLGLNHFLKENHNLIKNASCWIHLGANISAKSQKKKNNVPTPIITIQTSDEELEKLALKSMKLVEVKPSWKIPGTKRPYGEARNVFDGNGRYFSILGLFNPLFHHPDDRWPYAIDLNKTLKLTKALIDIGNRVANKN